MILDHYEAYGSTEDLQKYLPMAIGVVEGFRQVVILGSAPLLFLRSCCKYCTFKMCFRLHLHTNMKHTFVSQKRVSFMYVFP